MARADGRKCSSGKLSGHDGHDIKVVAAVMNDALFFLE